MNSYRSRCLHKITWRWWCGCCVFVVVVVVVSTMMMMNLMLPLNNTSSITSRFVRMVTNFSSNRIRRCDVPTSLFRTFPFPTAMAYMSTLRPHDSGNAYRRNQRQYKAQHHERYLSRKTRPSLVLLHDGSSAITSTGIDPNNSTGMDVNGNIPVAAFSTTTSTTSPSTTNEGGISPPAASTSRYKELLDDLGLQDLTQIRDHVGHTPRTISPYDIFCNRELKLKGIRAVGFDMDYTLAQYQQPAFDQLAFDGAKRKLVENLGYPEAVLDFQYDHTFWTRGLIIDTQRGNFLKIDRHKYVRVAYHGFDRMSSPTRKYLYSRTFNKVLSFSEKHFVNMDTLFQFVDAHLFASLVQLKDEGEHDALDMRTYEELYRHVRECVDLCHRDGVIKDEVHRNPSKYIVHDKGLLPMLHRYRQQGMKLFLLTNSLWEYTSTAMNYLYHGERVSDERQKKNEWLELFDLVIVGSCKPAYMLDPYLNLFRVRMEDGSLLNTDGLYEIEALGENGATKFLQKGKTFQGGNWLHLQAMLEIEAGEEILYVGDHLYSDVLRSKRTLGWRSAFIMPELEEEMRVFAQELPLNRQINSLRNLRDELGIYADQMRQNNPEKLSVEELENRLVALEQEDQVLKQKLQELTAEWHAAFHSIWGAMFNAGYQDSRFAFYVNNYACLYTSRATNLGLASIARSFRTTMEALPHDRLLDLDPHTTFVEDDPWDNGK